MKAAASILALILGSCTGASHIPPPWELPGAAVGTVIENATYGAKRKRVKAFLGANRDALFEDMQRGGGPVLTRAFELAKVSDEARAKLPAEILGSPDIYSSGPPEDMLENLTVAFMVYGN